MCSGGGALKAKPFGKKTSEAMLECFTARRTGKGGNTAVRHRPWPACFWGVTTLIVLVVFIGCAKRPVATTPVAPAAGAPPPPPPRVVAAPATPAPSLPVLPPATAASSPTPQPQQPETPPPPKEFVAIEALKDIHFDFDKYDIRPEDAKILDEYTTWMKANPSHLILVEGHADERGTNEYNLVLGERRAKATVTYLISRGVQAVRFKVISYGEESPLCSEKTEACWGKNRRAHFLVKAK